MRLQERYQGCLLGLAAGDALGTTLEFNSPGSFEPIVDMVGGGPFELPPGAWTDDTSMALCLAESLIACEGFDPEDQMKRYLRWFREGHWSSTGKCFDIGNTVLGALLRFEMMGDPFCGSEDPKKAGNGSIMRLAPVPMAFAGNPEEAIALAGESSRTTHGARETVDACRYLAGLIVGALEGRPKEELLSARFCPVEGLWEKKPLAQKIDAIAAGSFKEKEPPEIRGTGYSVESLEAALWAFFRSDSFQDGALLAVNLGDDADTTGAVYGQLAGAFYGVSGIPSEWREKIVMREQVEVLATGLLPLAGEIHPEAGYEIETEEDWLPRRLNLYVGGGGFGSSYRVRWIGAGLAHLYFEDREVKEVRFRSPSKRQWVSFWDQVEKLGVWDWLPEYPNPGVTDGTGWDVDLQYGGRSVESGGSNNFPVNGEMSNDPNTSPQFRKFCAAVRRLLGDLPFS